jgi:hypothetical protein
MGKNSDTLKFEYKGVDFLQFKAEDTIEALKSTDSALIELIVIGRSQYSTYQGEKRLQITIDNAEIRPVNIEQLF